MQVTVKGTEVETRARKGFGKSHMRKRKELSWDSLSLTRCLQVSLWEAQAFFHTSSTESTEYIHTASASLTPLNFLLFSLPEHFW